MSTNRPKRLPQEVVADKWEREAGDRERLAEKPDYTTIEKRLLRAQANVYRACVKELRGLVSNG
jgi:hypothetical protein